MAERDPQIGRLHSAYDVDYAAWISAQAELLSAQRFADLDLANLIDEVRSLGRSDYAAFVSAIEIVLVHMLKWDVQPARRTPSWVALIVEHRRRIARSLRDNPSYRSRLQDAVDQAFDTAVAKAAGETNLPLADFPDQNPFDWNAITARSYQIPA